MRTWIGALVAAGLVVLVAGWARADEPRGSHRGKGIVVAVSPGEITLKEGRELHRITVDRETRIMITAEHEVSGLGVGDYVAEECVSDGKGRVKALKLTLYRPAWMDLASPEN